MLPAWGFTDTSELSDSVYAITQSPLLKIAAVIQISQNEKRKQFSKGFRLFNSYERELRARAVELKLALMLTAHASATERSEPSSRALLIGEQPNAWELLHPRARASRHRGAERGRRYGRSGLTSLLSPE